MARRCATGLAKAGRCSSTIRRALPSGQAWPSSRTFAAATSRRGAGSAARAGVPRRAVRWGRHRVVLNIGGIANLTDLPARGEVRGFDTGPGNVLLDLWHARHRGGAYDDGGAWARPGAVNDALLDTLVAEPFFARRPPKSTGRDLFNAEWLDAKLAGSGPGPGRCPGDARRLHRAEHCRRGARRMRGATECSSAAAARMNAALMAALGALLAPRTVATTAERGASPYSTSKRWRSRGSRARPSPGVRETCRRLPARADRGCSARSTRASRLGTEIAAPVMSESARAVFLSYASQDAEAARRICEALRKAGLEVWFDQSELARWRRVGRVDPQADQGMRVVCSTHLGEHRRAQRRLLPARMEARGRTLAPHGGRPGVPAAGGDR